MRVYSHFRGSTRGLISKGWNWATVLLCLELSSARAQTTGPPQIVGQPSSQIATNGQKVLLEVSATGAVPLQYQWLMNDDDLPGETKSSLVISNAQFWNSGGYSVVVSNRFGSATSKRAFVRVDSRPVILDQPQPVLTIPGANVVFQVRATGTPKLRYQWFRDNGVLLTNVTKPTLVVSNVQQSAQYYVKVNNDIGTAQSQSVPLSVIIPPRIITQPASRTARLGQTVSFTVVADGTQPLSYRWRHNGNKIEWGTTATLVVSNVAPRDAGNYDVVVANGIGAVNSNPAALTLEEVPFIFLADKITAAELYTMPSFLGRSDNLQASNDPGEMHCGRVGGSSVWMRWMAQEPGIVRFETSGSSFDTVLAAYTMDRSGALKEVACDDDEGDFFGSRIRFAAMPDAVYFIAIDGLDGARGRILLEWELEPTRDALPLITLQPQDQTANIGDSVVFSVKVEANPGVPLFFQWYHNGVPIQGANGTELPVPFRPDPPRGITRDDVGYYHVEILQMGEKDRVVKSRRALLEISLADVDNRLLYAFAVDKFADAFDRNQRQGHLGGVQSVDELGFAPVLGYTGTQIFSTIAFGGEPGELSHCGIPGGSSAWFSFIPAASGRLYLDTAGSSFNTVLAVYTGPGPTIASLTALACDNDSGPGTTSSLNFPATKNTTYYIAVDGYNGVTGTAHLNYRLLIPIALTDTIKTNDSICGFRVTATPAYPFSIERCVGFSIWTNVLTTNRPNGIFDYYDTNAIVQKRFYRARQTP